MWFNQFSLKVPLYSVHTVFFSKHVHQSIYSTHLPHTFWSSASHQTCAWFIVYYALLTHSMLSNSLPVLCYFTFVETLGISVCLFIHHLNTKCFNSCWIKICFLIVLILLVAISFLLALWLCAAVYINVETGCTLH